MRLYHYCCAHSALAIGAEGWLRPMMAWSSLDRALTRHGAPPTGLAHAPPVLWLTDLPEPDRHGLGLTSFTLSCDRTEFRFTVETNLAQPWADYRRLHRPNHEWLEWLHSGLTRPDRWWVATQPLRAAERIDYRALHGLLRPGA